MAARRGRAGPRPSALTIQKVDEPNAEHLEFALMTRGYEAKARSSSEPKGGAMFSLFADFGDLHRRLDLQEVFPGNGSDGDKKDGDK